jgi:hypothetical protein
MALSPNCCGAQNVDAIKAIADAKIAVGGLGARPPAAGKGTRQPVGLLVDAASIPT